MQTEYQTDPSSAEDTDVRQKVEETASTLVDQAQQVATTQVTSQKERAATALDAVAKTLYESSSSMREGQPQIASLADGAASRVVDASAYLREHDLRDLASEAENLARREPVLFLGAAFALGFVAARFLKASAPRSTASAGGRSTGREPNYDIRGQASSPRSLGAGYGHADYTSGSSEYDRDTTSQR